MTPKYRGFMVGGTGLWAPGLAFDPLGVGHRAAKMYYHHILTALNLEMIDLPYGGWQHPELCFRGVSRAIANKRGDSTDRFILVGHSQGVLRSLEYAMANPDDVEKVIGIMGPLAGSFRATLQLPIPGGRGMAPGSRR